MVVGGVVGRRVGGSAGQWAGGSAGRRVGEFVYRWVRRGFDGSTPHVLPLLAALLNYTFRVEVVVVVVPVVLIALSARRMLVGHRKRHVSIVQSVRAFGGQVEVEEVEHSVVVFLAKVHEIALVA